MKNPTYFIGLDVHKKLSNACVLDEEGNKLLECRIPSTSVGVDCLTNHLPRGEWKVALEASSCVYPLVDALRDKDFNVQLTHPAGIKWITASNKKTDQVDARKLAELLRLGVLPQAYAPTKEIRRVRSLARERIQLKQHQTMIKNQIHRRLEISGVKLESKLSSKKGREELSFVDDDLIHRKLRLMDVIRESTREINDEIHNVFESNKEAQLLASMPGVGEYSAVLITSEIGDIKRFPSPKKLCAYAGLVPTVRQTGETTRLGCVRKQCNKNLKWILTQCAQIAVKHDPRLGKFHRRIKQQKGGKKAIIATSHKMLTIMYWMLIKQQPYAIVTP